MAENESVGPEQSTPAEAEAESEVIEGFKSAGLNEMQAFRTAEAVRAQAGHNIKEALEVHQGKVDTKVDSAESRLTAKIDGVDTKVDGVETRLTAKVDGVDTKVDGVESRLTAKVDGVDTKVDSAESRLTAKIDGVDTKVDGVETRLTAKVDGVDTKVDRVETKMDGVKTELKADIAVQGAELKADIKERGAELKAIKRELAFYRWLFIILVALLALLATIGLLPRIERWLGWDSTPTQSVQTPVEANPTETVVPPEADSPEQPPE